MGCPDVNDLAAFLAGSVCAAASAGNASKSATKNRAKGMYNPHIR